MLSSVWHWAGATATCILSEKHTFLREKGVENARENNPQKAFMPDKRWFYDLPYSPDLFRSENRALTGFL